MSDIQERISFKIFGVIQDAAEGRFAIVGLVVVTALVLASMVWLRIAARRVSDDSIDRKRLRRRAGLKGERPPPGIEGCRSRPNTRPRLVRSPRDLSCESHTDHENDSKQKDAEGNQSMLKELVVCRGDMSAKKEFQCAVKDKENDQNKK
jgi:hypothetical protein